MKENSFIFKKTRSGRYPAVIMTVEDYADDLVILENTPAQTESLLHSLKQTVRYISLFVNENKREVICFKLGETISILSSKRLELVK